MRALGRALQLLGLILLPTGLLFGIEGGHGAMSREIAFGLAGVACFLAGVKIQRRAE